MFTFTIINDKDLENTCAELFNGMMKVGKGLCITAEHESDRKGYKIDKFKNNTARVAYGDLPSFFNAMTEIAVMKKGDCSAEAVRCSSDLGVMIDCSRNAVMRPERLKALIRKLAMLGYSYVQLYTEDTFEVEGEPYFGYMRGRYTVEEIQDVDTYARRFGLELIPCIQTLAHFTAMFKWESIYEDIHDCEDILLLRNEKTYEFIEKLVATARKAFSATRINIGMDEAHLLGAGRFLDNNGYVQRSELMNEHIKKVVEICKKYNFRPAMWNDMFYRISGCRDYYCKEGFSFSKTFVKSIPDVDMIYWDYYNTDTDLCRRMIKTGKQLGKRLIFAGGAWKWACIAPQNKFSVPRTTAALTACREEGIDDIMVTCWGDNGAECPVFAIMPSFIFYSEMAYRGTVDDVTEKKSAFVTGYTYEELSDFDLPNRMLPDIDKKDEYSGNPSRFFLYNDPFIGLYDWVVPEKAKETCLENAKRLMELGKKKGEFQYIYKTFESLSRVLAVKTDLGVRIRNAYESKNKGELKRIASKDFSEVAKKLKAFYDQFRATWLKDNKAFGLEVIDTRIGGLLLRLEYGADILKKYASGKLDKIDELEEKQLPVNPDAKNCQIHEPSFSRTYTGAVL